MASEQMFLPSWSPSRDQIVSILALSILSVFTYTIYGAYFDSLSAYPGPKLWAISDLPRAYHMLRGDIPYKLVELHKKYGPVVRIGRRFLSYTTPDAWNDIYAKIRPELSRDPKSLPPPPNGVYGVGFCPSDSDHSRMRRNISYGFTDKALKDQEPILTKYFDVLIQKLNENCTKGPVDLSKFFNLVTVDIIGDLTFGQSFDCLKTSVLHVWMQNIFDFVKGYVVIGVCMTFPPLGTLVTWLGSKVFAEQEAVHRGFVRERLAKRLEMKDPRPDFMTYAQSYLNSPAGMSIEELQETCVSLMIAGSETTATLLSGVVYHLLKNPPILERLVKEIRTTFETEDSINMLSVGDLKYELAVLQEALRIFPPVANQVQRITGPEGNMIAGRFVPGRTLVSVSQKACFSSAENFRDPNEFVPERWLGDERYKNDRKNALQPFSVGPRNCIGMNLAYVEMRIILARLLWNFDIELCKESNNWAERMKVFMMYQREPLMVKLIPILSSIQKSS